MKKLIALFLLVATCLTLFTSCDSEPTSAMDLWKKTQSTMKGLSSYREDSTINITGIVEGVFVDISTDGFVIIAGGKKRDYYYNYSATSVSYNNSYTETSTRLIAYDGGKMFSAYEAAGEKSALCSKMSAKNFKNHMDDCASEWQLSPKNFETLSFEKISGSGWILNLSDAKENFIDLLYSDEGLVTLGIPKPKDINATLRTDEKFRAIEIKIELSFKESNTSFSMRSKYSHYNSAEKKPIYRADYTEVEDLRPLDLVAGKMQDTLTAKKASFVLKITDEAIGLSMADRYGYYEKDKVTYETTEDGFSYDVSAVINDESYKIVFKDKKQTVTVGSTNKSTTINMTEYRAYYFIMTLINSSGFSMGEIKDISFTSPNTYTFTCEVNDNSRFVELIEALDDTYVSHTMKITVTFKDGEIKEITSIIKATGKIYARTVKTSLIFSELVLE